MSRAVLILLLGCGGFPLTAWATAGQQVVVVLDDSGSMSDVMRSNRRVAKIDAAKSALLQVLAQLPDDAQVGVYALNSRTENGPWIIPLGPIDRARVQFAVGRIQAQGGTPLGVAMKEAANALLAQRERQFYGDYRLLIVTDGEAQDQPLLDRYLPEILARQIAVDVIGVSMSQSHSLATRVSRYRRADDPAALQQAIEASLAETPRDVQDADEASDFELLAGLPDEFAVTAIKALTQTNNRPIGSDTLGDDDAPVGGLTPSLPAPGPPPAGVPAPLPEPPDTGVSKIFVFVIMLVIVMVFRLLKSRGRRRRRY